MTTVLLAVTLVIVLTTIAKALVLLRGRASPSQRHPQSVQVEILDDNGVVNRYSTPVEYL